MFELKKQFYFEAGHVLIHHDGKCRRPHGHSYMLTVCLRTNTLIENGPKTNMVMDFADVSIIVKEMIVTYLDHHWLNDTLQCDSPTAEYIARWIYYHLKPKIPMLVAVSLNETSSSVVTFSEGEGL